MEYNGKHMQLGGLESPPAFNSIQTGLIVSIHSTPYTVQNSQITVTVS